MDLARDLNPSQREAVEYTGGPHAGGGRRRQRQDPGDHLQGGGADRLGPLPAGADPGGHVHQQGRRRDEGTDPVPAGRAGHPDAHGLHLPLLLRAFPAPEIEALGWPRDYTIYDSDDQLRLIKNILKAMQANEKLVTPDLVQYRIGQAKIHAIGPDEYARRFFRPEDATVAEAYPDLRAEPPAERRAGFRRSHPEDQRDTAAIPRRPRGGGPPVPLPAGGRVPGLQPAPVRAGPAPDRRTTRTSAWSGTRTSPSTASAGR